MGVERAMKTPNGTAWVLFKDETSLQKTLEIYHSGRSLLPSHFGFRITNDPLNGAGPARRASRGKCSRVCRGEACALRAPRGPRAAIYGSPFIISSVQPSLTGDAAIGEARARGPRLRNFRVLGWCVRWLRGWLGACLPSRGTWAPGDFGTVESATDSTLSSESVTACYSAVRRRGRHRGRPRRPRGAGGRAARRG
jgi:hypothetical protein